MKAMTLAAAAGLAGALFLLTPAHANTVWDFSTPPGDQGLTHTYIGDDTTSQITASAFGPAAGCTPASTGTCPHLFGKNLGSDELGLGLTNDPSGENEITTTSFIQLDLSKLVLTSSTISFSANSVTNGETVVITQLDASRKFRSPCHFRRRSSANLSTPFKGAHAHGDGSEQGRSRSHPSRSNPVVNATNPKILWPRGCSRRHTGSPGGHVD
jgi:hypothetical protein